LRDGWISIEKSAPGKALSLLLEADEEQRENVLSELTSGRVKELRNDNAD
jgi:hypothetical protein